MNAKGVEELVAEGYHSGDVLVSARESDVRSYIAETGPRAAEVVWQTRATTVPGPSLKNR